MEASVIQDCAFLVLLDVDISQADGVFEGSSDGSVEVSSLVDCLLILLSSFPAYLNGWDFRHYCSVLVEVVR